MLYKRGREAIADIVKIINAPPPFLCRCGGKGRGFNCISEALVPLIADIRRRR